MVDIFVAGNPTGASVSHCVAMTSTNGWMNAAGLAEGWLDVPCCGDDFTHVVCQKREKFCLKSFSQNSFMIISHTNIMMQISHANTCIMIQILQCKYHDVNITYIQVSHTNVIYTYISHANIMILMHAIIMCMHENMIYLSTVILAAGCKNLYSQP